MASEVSGNLFFTTKGGFKAHVQVKETIETGHETAPSILDLLAKLEENIVADGGKPETAFTGSTGGRKGGRAEEESFGAKKDPGDGQCPNGCGPRPWIEGGVSRKTGKAYSAFWGECRTCGYKGR